MSTECADTVSLMHGPLFLTDRQFTAPKEIGPGLSEISPKSNSRVMTLSHTREIMCIQDIAMESAGVCTFAGEIRWK